MKFENVKVVSRYLRKNLDPSEYLEDSSKVYYTIPDKFNLKQVIKDRTKNITSGTILFGKSSKFPRFKLQESPFKRCVKLDKADAVVIGDISGDIKTMQIFKTNDSIIMFDPDAYYYTDNFNESNLFRVNKVAYLMKLGILPTNAVEIYNGDVLCTKDEDVMNIMDDTYKVIITDDMLDAAVSTQLDDLTKDVIDNVYEMLASPDTSIMGLGLKVLASYNVLKYPGTVRLLLGMHPHIQNCSEWNSVSVKRLKKSINFIGFVSLYSMYNVQAEKISEEDKTLCKPLLYRLVKADFEKYVKNVNYSLQRFGMTYDMSLNEM